MLCLLGLLLFSMLLILLVAGMEDLDGMKVDYGANRLWGECTVECPWDARFLFSTEGSAHGACVLLHCGGCRVARNAEFRTPFDGAYLGRVFPSFAVPVCLGAVGRRVSLARCADDPGSPVGTALALGGPPQDGGTAGCVDVGPVREGFLPLGMGAASAPLDVTACASFPLRGKSVATSTHRHPHA